MFLPGTATEGGATAAMHLTMLAQNELIFRLLLKMTVGKGPSDNTYFWRASRPNFNSRCRRFGSSKQPDSTLNNHRRAHAFGAGQALIVILLRPCARGWNLQARMYSKTDPV